MAQGLSSNDGFISGAGLVFRRSALCLVWSVKVWSITSGCLCRERLFTGERSVVGFLPKGNKKAPQGLGYWLSMPFTNAPARLPSRVPWNKCRTFSYIHFNVQMQSLRLIAVVGLVFYINRSSIKRKAPLAVGTVLAYLFEVYFHSVVKQDYFVY